MNVTILGAGSWGKTLGLVLTKNGHQVSLWGHSPERIAEILGKPIRTRPLTLATAGLRARRPRYCALSNAKLVAAGVQMPPWPDAVREFLGR